MRMAHCALATASLLVAALLFVDANASSAVRRGVASLTASARGHISTHMRAGNSALQHRNNVAAFASSAARLTEHFQALSASDALASVQCHAALVTAQMVVANCTDPAEALFQSTSQNQIEAFCSDSAQSCSSLVHAAMLNVVDQCSNELQLDVVRAMHDRVVGHIKAVCTRHAGEYCLPRVVGLAEDTNEREGSDAPLTDELLNSLCHPCIAKFLRAADMVDDEENIDTDFFNVVCLKHEGEFCAVHVQSTFRDESEGGDVNPFCQPDICHPCTRKFVAALAKSRALKRTRDRRRENDDIGNGRPSQPPGSRSPPGRPEEKDGLKAFGVAMRSFCTVDDNGRLCLESAPECDAGARASQDLVDATCEASFASNTTCTAGCKAELEVFAADQGCCLASRLEMIREFASEFEEDDEGAEEFERRIAFVEDVCEVELPGQCSSIESNTVTVTVELGNLRPEYANANTNEVCEALTMDLVEHLGLISSQYQSCTFDAATSVFTITLRVQRDGADSVAGELVTGSSAQRLSWSSTETSIGLNARSAPLDPISVNVQTATTSLAEIPAAGDESAAIATACLSRMGTLGMAFAALMLALAF